MPSTVNAHALAGRGRRARRSAPRPSASASAGAISMQTCARSESSRAVMSTSPPSLASSSRAAMRSRSRCAKRRRPRRTASGSSRSPTNESASRRSVRRSRAMRILPCAMATTSSGRVSDLRAQRGVRGGEERGERRGLGVVRRGRARARPRRRPATSAPAASPASAWRSRFTGEGKARPSVRASSARGRASRSGFGRSVQRDRHRRGGFRRPSRLELSVGVAVLALVSLDQPSWTDRQPVLAAPEGQQGDGVATFGSQTLGGALLLSVVPSVLSVIPGVGIRYAF